MTKKILLVDDSKFMRMRLKKQLVQADCEVVEAENGQDALDQVRMHAPQLVICDVNMPIMEGPEFVKMLFQHDPTVPVIMLTANPDRDLKFAVMDYNVRAFMSKLHPVEKIAEKILITYDRIYPS